MGLTLLAAAPAGAANNPGTGDPGFFTFRPSPGVGGTQINVASGNALVRTRDLADSAANYNVVVDRFYNSLAPDTFSILSPRWGYDVGPATGLTVESNQDATVSGPSGYRIRFARQSDGSYTAPAGFDGSLTKTSAGWTLARASQNDQFGFDNNGQLSWTKDAATRDFTIQGTSAAGRTVLSSYGTTSGRRANFSYTGDSLVREMDDPSSGHHYYRYTSGRLTEYEAPNGAETTYRYDGNGRLDKITEPGGTTVELNTTAGGRVSSITTTLPGAIGQTTSFVYTRRPYKTDVTAPDGVRRTYAYDDDWRVTRQYNPDATPTVVANGDLPESDDDGYVGPNRTYPVDVSANEPDGPGIKRIAVARADGTEISGVAVQCASTPFDSICPQAHQGTVAADFGSLSEGPVAVRASATDEEGNRGLSEGWTVLVDKTAPTAPNEFEVEAFDAPSGTALVTWMPGLDPDLTSSIEGSQVDGSQFRVRRDGTWTAWSTIEEDGFDLTNTAAGEQIEVEARSVDGVGNVGPAASASLTIAQPVDEAEDDPTGTGNHDLRVTAQRDLGDDGVDPIVGGLITATSNDRQITARTNDDGVATFPKIENGDYRVKLVTEEDAAGDAVTVSGTADQTLTYTAGQNAGVAARSARSGGGDSPLSITGDLRVWCATGQYKDVDTPGIPGLLLCRKWNEDADLALYLEKRLFDHRGAQDSTRANAFRHMVWNALMVNTVTQRFGDNSDRQRQAIVFSTDVYEYDGVRTTDVSAARASTMDRHNNRLGWGYMVRRTPARLGGKVIPDFGVCKRIRRLVGSVQKATYKRGTGRFSRQFNRYRPVYYKELDLAGYRVKLKPQTASFDPCGPLKPGRSN